QARRVAHPPVPRRQAVRRRQGPPPGPRADRRATEADVRRVLPQVRFESRRPPPKLKMVPPAAASRADVAVRSGLIRDNLPRMPRPRHNASGEKSRRYHDRVARQYDAIYDDPYWHFHDELTWRAIKPHLPRDVTAACCDLGCGTGKWGLKLLKSGFATTFVDHSAAMVEQVREKLEGNPRAKKATLLVADIVDMPALSSEQFSLVVAMGDPLSICSDPLAAAREMHRISKPGGVVIATADNKLAALDHFVERGNLDALEQ